MGGILNIFDSIEHLEPRCPGCNVVIKYCINTKFDDKINAHKCINCGEILK